MTAATLTGQTQQTTAGLVNALADDPSWCPAVQTCVVPSVDTIQQLNATGVVAAWGSLVEIGATPLTANAIITLPASAGNAGKTITFKRLDNTAFTVTLNPAAGDAGEVTTPTVLNSQFGALTVEAVSSTKYEQVSNISAAVAATTNALTASGAAFVSTVDSVVATLTPTVGTIQDNLGFNAAGALVKAAPAATTNLLASSAAAITSTVDGVAATLTPAVGVIQDGLGFDAAGALVKAAPTSSGILIVDGTQTANRVQTFNTFTQTWNNLGGFTKNIVTGSELINLSDTFTPGTAQANFSYDVHNLVVNDGLGSSAALTVTPTLSKLEVNGGGVNKASFHIEDGTVGGAIGDPQLYLKTNSVSGGTAVAGQVLTLSAATGEAEFVTAPSSVDTIQTANVSGTTTVTAWGSVVLVPTLIGNITILYPTPVGNIGKTIKVVQTGVPNAFTITHTPTVGTVTFTNAAGELAEENGAITVEAVDVSSVRQVSNSVAAPTVATLSYGRVRAQTTLTNQTYIGTGDGSPVPFNATSYASGMTVVSNYTFIPTVSGRYRASWLMMAGSELFNDDGFFHIVSGSVSVGQVRYNMMQAAGVNQCAGFIDVDLVAGAGTILYYRAADAGGDQIAWDAGSYFQIDQLPTAIASVVNTVAEYGEANTMSANSLTIPANTDTDVVSFTLPSAGTWKVDYNALYQINSDGNPRRIWISSASNVVVLNSTIGYVSNITGTPNSGPTMNGTVFITTSAAETFKLRARGAVSGIVYRSASLLLGGDTDPGATKVSWVKVAGQLPSTGNSVDYAYARLSTNAAIANVATDLSFGSFLQGNIPNALGVFTLTADKTYSLSANFLGLSFDQATTQGTIRFVDSTNTQVYGSPSIVLRPSTDTSLNGTTPGFEFVFTPSATGNYKFRADAAGVGRSFQIGQSESSVSIHQLGSSLNTVGTLAAVDNSGAGYIDFGNMRMQWGLHDDGNADTTTVTLPALFLNNNYVVTATSNNGVAGSVSVEAKTTSSFDLDRASTTATTNIWGWQAVGMKP
jgi:hypothetical protein